MYWCLFERVFEQVAEVTSTLTSATGWWESFGPLEDGMRQYDDTVDVRRGLVRAGEGTVEGPEQFLWRGRLWKVRTVVAHWVETGPWWRSSGAAAVLGGESGDHADGTDDDGEHGTVPRQRPASVHDLLAEREVWRVEAARGRAGAGAGAGHGVFDLAFDWAGGSWLLTRCLD